MFSHFDRQQPVQQFDGSFDKEQSRSIFCFLYGLQMTIVHLSPVWLILSHLHQEEPAFRSKEAVLLPFLSQSETVFRDTPNVLVSPRKLLRSWYDLIISSLRSSGYPFGAGFSRLRFLHDLQ